jgi:hypothetical protein
MFWWSWSAVNVTGGTEGVCAAQQTTNAEALAKTTSKEADLNELRTKRSMSDMLFSLLEKRFTSDPILNRSS